MGMVAPDETTYAYLAGPAVRAQGRHVGAAPSRPGAQLPSDADAKFDREVAIDVRAIAPQITWGTSPEHVIAVDQRIPDPGERRRSQPARRHGGGARLHGPDARRADRGHQGRLGVHRLVHQQPHLRPARRGRRRARPQGGAGRARLGGAGLRDGEARRGGRGARPRLPRRRLRMARARLLDVPRRQRRDRAAGPALRLHLQPQLRRPAGAAARARISPAPPWPRPRRSPGPSPTCAGWGAEPWTSLRRSIRRPRRSCARTSTPT